MRRRRKALGIFYEAFKTESEFWPGVDLANPQMESTKLPVSEQVDPFLKLIEGIYQDLDKSTFDEVALDLMIQFYELCSDSKISHADDIKMLVSVIKQKDLLTLKASIRSILGKEAAQIKKDTAALAVSLLENLITTLEQTTPTDALDPVNEYLEIARDLIAEDPSLFQRIEAVSIVLNSYGWKDGLFLYPPKLELLVQDLRTVLSTGRPPLKRSSSMTDSQKLRILRSDPLVMAVVRSLIDDVLSPSTNLDKAVTDYFDLVDGLAVERHEAKAEVAPVTKILLDYGWTPKGFGQPVDRQILARDLRVVSGEIKV